MKTDQESDVGVGTEVPSSEKPASSAPPEPVDAPPDGGLDAWLSVACAWLISFMTFGIVNIWGVLLNAYVNAPSSRFRDQSLARIGYVGGCGVGFTFAVGPLSNLLVTRFGMRATISVGVIVVAVAFELASISTSYWELLLSEGILFGIGSSLAYIPAIGLPSQWFAKRRSLATSIASSGSGIGAVILSPVIQALINHVSIEWALRFIGFLCFVFGLGGVASVRYRTAGRGIQYRAYDWSIFKVPGYNLYLMFTFTQFFGFGTPLFFIPSFCTAIGISATNSSGVISVSTAAQVIGRVAAGYLADRAGPINILGLFNFCMGLTCIIIWYFATNLGVMMVFGIFYGFFSGVFWALSVPVTAKIVGLEKLGTAVAVQFLAVVIPPIFTVPIGSRIIGATAAHLDVSQESREAYKYLIVYSFLISTVSSLFLLPVRLRFSKRLIAKV
ncbi:major facilitator superfamily domain-containing protein [Fomitopsis serialis]|uniref:major facilitator superfamily domain-containing protein n=1 Tax=Fomitopsis serialis TaxID=139415 RepID=UPI002007E7AA|nr:major facilitator superfamily domain-containing protein [Neoantrodia serialis]KAH9934336.1 major facilitator superfamily domain-containing protein [Neoantrodia serialis]